MGILSFFQGGGGFLGQRSGEKREREKLWDTVRNGTMYRRARREKGGWDGFRRG